MDLVHNDYQPTIELPQPQTVAGAENIPPPSEATATGSPEAQAARMELPTTLPAQQPPAPLPVIDPTLQAPPPLPGQPATAGPPASTYSPAIADDLDIIEKEWVSKAKAIIAETKDDPHRQSKEINKFKADYIKKRYDREIKLAQD